MVPSITVLAVAHTPALAHPNFSIRVQGGRGIPVRGSRLVSEDCLASEDIVAFLLTDLAPQRLVNGGFFDGGRLGR
jgi:hypothetical protein